MIDSALQQGTPYQQSDQPWPLHHLIQAQSQHRLSRAHKRLSKAKTDNSRIISTHE
ncbi:hypothetical protein Q4488_00425 [Amphritea sp. 1_MG-2023]|uniref:hypothetical protein n=1 Tax=Amphritea sp. 1_MG-2023 TaxID=3062670 RepID=UPI0026E434ED|nr:hypothetical protein [Amphritea sp. 1_MG-2023]MDO6561836.1 hypothetical protein [Amphritea sp. 1_MG-2023]